MVDAKISFSFLKLSEEVGNRGFSTVPESRNVLFDLIPESLWSRTAEGKTGNLLTRCYEDACTLICLLNDQCYLRANLQN